MQQENHFLFVYGSLLSGFRSPAYEYLSGYFECAGPAETEGSMFHNGKFPVAISEKGTQRIKGELWKIRNENEAEWAFAQLDDYEGVNVMPGESPLYQRQITKVYSGSVIVEAWVYWYNRTVEGMTAIPSGNVFDFLA